MKKAKSSRIGFERLESREMLSTCAGLGISCFAIITDFFEERPASLVGTMLSSSAATVAL